MEATATDIKLNLGAAKTRLDGFIAIDRTLGSEVYPLPYATDSIGVIRASHILEHFSHTVTLLVLAEWVRVLRPGGMLKIAVPDFTYAIQHATHPHFEGWVMGGHCDENDFHGALFWEKKLRTQMEGVGITNITKWKSEIQDCAALPVSLNLCGVKRER